MPGRRTADFYNPAMHPAAPARIAPAPPKGGAIGLAAVLAAMLALAAVGIGNWPHGEPPQERGASPLFIGFLFVAFGASCAAFGALWAALRARDALHELRQREQALSATTDAWLWQSDADHRLVALRPPPDAPASAWAGSAARPDDQTPWQRFGGDAATVEAAALAQRMREGSAIDGVAITRASAGGERWRINGRPRIDSSGRFAGYLGLAWPQHPEASISIRNAPAAAAPRVDDEAAAASQDAFVYSVSHDLRAPIRVVEGFARILKEDHGRMLDRIGNDHVDRILGASARMHHMIDALLELSRLGAMPIARRKVDLSAIAEEIVADLRREAPARCAVVEIEPALTAEGDPALLRSMLENLLGNAWKYSARREETRISMRRDGDAIVVADNGAGFDMRFADRLFGAFQRLHSANDFSGTGIGLASAKRIVQRHGGDISAESQVDGGARFRFTLPAARA